MADREMVIKGLELCLQGDINFCKPSCPYFHQCGGFYENNEALLKDALSLLKEQEPRLIKKDDFKKADAWGMIPAWVEFNPAIEGAEPGWEIVGSGILGSPFKRAWTKRPTDEQRKAVKWDG